MIDRIYGDGSYLGSGRRALCYESLTYSLYYDYQFVMEQMVKDEGGLFSPFSFVVYKVEHATKINSIFTTIRVVNVGTGLDDFIHIISFRRLWNKDIVYDANNNTVYTLHYDAKSGKFIRANFKQLVGGPESSFSGGDNSIGTRRGKIWNTPLVLKPPPKEQVNTGWLVLMISFITFPGSKDARYYNNMDLDIDNNRLDRDTYTYSNTNYLRNYYFDGVLVTVHSGTWGQGHGNQATSAGASVTLV